MKIDKKKTAIKSIAFGFTNKVITLIVPFLVRTIMIYQLGIQYLGLSAVFSSILSILSFAELGFGSVLIYSMYKPIAEDDKVTICALYNLYKEIYRIIGVIVLVIGLCIMPFIKYFISGTYPSNINLYVLYIIYLFNAVISYWLFAYKNSLLSAYQKYYVTSNINTISSLLMYAGQIIVLLTVRNYYVYVILLPLSTIANNLLTSITVEKIFPQYSTYGKVTKSQAALIKKTVLAGIGHKLGPTATDSVDNIVISSYLGLVALAIFSNYNYVFNAVMGFVALLFSSLTAGIGNSIVTETVDKNYADFRKINFINNWIVGCCSVCLLCLSQHFIYIWLGKDYMYKGMTTVILLVVMFYAQQIRTIVTTYKSAAGMWYIDRWKPYVSVILNLIFDLIFIRFWGVNGVIVATILARVVVGLPWETEAMFRHYFMKKTGPYYLTLILYAAVTIVACSTTYFLCSFLPSVGIVWLFVKFAICVCVTNLIFVAAYFKRIEFKQVLGMFKNR